MLLPSGWNKSFRNGDFSSNIVFLGFLSDIIGFGEEIELVLYKCIVAMLRLKGLTRNAKNPSPHRNNPSILGL